MSVFPHLGIWQRATKKHNFEAFFFFFCKTAGKIGKILLSKRGFCSPQKGAAACLQ